MTSPLSRVAVVTSALAVVAAGSACADEPLTGPDQAGRLDVQISALTLSGVGNANYTLEVLNEGGQTVFTKTFDSAQYGAAASASYVGTCDASDPNVDGAAENTVQLTVNGLEDELGDPIPAASWQNPTEGGPLERVVDCVENTDVAVTFDIAILRAAEQGFFDIAVNFDDLFCSAKADCEYGTDQPIELLHDANGDRQQTLVMGFACTGGEGSDTHLYWQSVAIGCDGPSYDLAAAMSASAPGNRGALGGLVFQHAYYFGAEQLGTYDKLYFNIAVGLDVDELGVNGHTDCTLDAVATMSDGPLAGGQTPDGSAWPVVTWTIPINAGSSTTLACTRHPLNGGNGLATSYTDLDAPESMRFEVDNDGGTVSVTDLAPPAPPAAPTAGPYITPEVTVDRLQIFSTDTLQLVWSRDATQQTTPAARVVLLDASGDIVAYSSSVQSGGGGTATFPTCGGGSQTGAVGDLFTVGVIANSEFDSDCAAMNAGATILREQPMVVSGASIATDYVTLGPLTVTSYNRFNIGYSRSGAQTNYAGGLDLHVGMIAADGTAQAYGNTYIPDSGSGTIIEFYQCDGATGNTVVGQSYTMVVFAQDDFDGSSIQAACDSVTNATPLQTVGLIAQ